MINLFKSIFSKKDNTKMENLIKEGAFLVDVRTPGEFAEGHIKGSTNIPVDQISQQLQQFKGKENIIVFCRSGARSAQAKSILENSGITNVTNGGTWQSVKALVPNG
jgi:phage shock protein E